MRGIFSIQRAYNEEYRLNESATMNSSVLVYYTSSCHEQKRLIIITYNAHTYCYLSQKS